MARSITCRFFMTPVETVELVDSVAGSSRASVFVQLQRPGLVLEPVTELREVVLSPIEQGRLLLPRRVLLTHQQLPGVAGEGLFDGFAVPGLVLVTVPFVEGNRFYLGSAGAKFVDEQDPDAVMARALVRDIRRLARGRLSVRSLRSGATTAAKGVGGSEAAMQLASKQCLQLRQFGVENSEFLVYDQESRR